MTKKNETYPVQHTITEAAELRDLLHLSETEEKQMADILEKFPLRVPPYYLSLIDWDNADDDPIRKMCIPSIAETDLSGDLDTSGEGSNTVMKGLQHKYHATTLILSTQHCAMYCRHCFRKRLVGLSDQEEAGGDIAAFAEYVRNHPEISNVLVSGGDAFMNTNSVIQEYIDRFSEIGHLDLIRFGTRIPVVLPQRISDDPELLQILKDGCEKKQLYVVTQFNHPKEITSESIRAVKALMHSGVIVRNQTVLLRGINDDSQILGTLLRDLTKIGVLPYYIFQCRPVTAVKNQFTVPLLEGYDIVEGAKRLQNGQGKGVRYVMSHKTGKIEIIGKARDSSMIMKYHQAKGDRDAGRIFTIDLKEDQCWIDTDIPQN